MNYITNKNDNGLVYEGMQVKDLVNKDSDRDGILDWEEPLWGLDPTKKETTPGVPDISVINKLKKEEGINIESTSGEPSVNEENLTETEKFSRELLSTITVLSQQGEINENTIKQITDSLSEKMQNSVPRKAFTEIDIKTTGNLYQNYRNYNDTLNNIFIKNPPKGNIPDIMKKFIVDENNVNPSVLGELDPIITSIKNVINDMSQVQVPKSIIQLHLELLNNMEKMTENLEDIRQYDTDIILSFAGIIQFENNKIGLENTIKKLGEVLSEKLNN